MRNDILCIDVGSTNIKYALYTDFHRRGGGSLPFPAPCRSGDGFFEVRTQEIVGAVTRIIRDAPRGCGVLFSVQMHGHVLSGRRDTYVSWRDTRSQKGDVFTHCRRDLARYFSAASGTSLKPNLAVCSLLYDMHRGLPVQGELFSLGSYLAFALTGNNIAHESDLAALGFYLRGGQENGALLAALPYSVILPRCTAFPQACGVFEGHTVYTPFGDQQCSVFALRAGHAAVLNVGTAAQICRVADGLCAGDYESRPYFGDTTLCTRTGLAGGACFAERGADSAALCAEYRAAFEAVGARGRAVCTGGAFAFYGKELAEAVRRCGLQPEFAGADALDGLMMIYREYLWKQER